MLLQYIVRQGDHLNHLPLELFDDVAEGQVLFAYLHVLLLMTLGDHQIEVLLMTIVGELDVGV